MDTDSTFGSQSHFDQRAVSEILGFILVLMLGLALTFGTVVVGVDRLTTVSDEQAMEAAQGELTSLEADFYKLTEGLPYQSTKVALPGDLTYGDSTTITVEMTGGGSTKQLEVSPEPIIMRSGGDAMVIEGAGVISDPEKGSAMISNPRWDIRENRSVISLMETYQDGGSTLISGTDATVVGYRSAQTTKYLNPLSSSGDNNPVDVTITVESKRYRAWRNYFESHDQITVSNFNPGAQEVSATFQSKAVIIQKIEVSTRYES